MAIFKQSTNYVHQFLMVLSADHVSGATGKTPAVELGKNGAAGSAAAGTVAEVDAANLPGVYKITFTAADVGTLGSLAFYATAAGCDPTNEVHQVQTQIFPDLLMNASGQVLIASNVKQNAAYYLPFIMTVNSTATPGLGGFVAQRSLAGAGFAPCVNPVVELGAGWYGITLAAADTNAAVIALHITATNADARDITLYTQP